MKLDLPSPETIKKYTISVNRSPVTFIKARQKNLEAGLTMNGDPRKMKYVSKPRKTLA